MSWARAHWVVGTLTLLLFPMAGLYMRHVALVPQLDDATRMVFRSRFLFLLLAAVANLALAGVPHAGAIRRTASVLILAAPFPLAVAFFVDPYQGVQASAWSVYAMYAFFAAAVSLAVVNRPRRWAP